MKIASVDSDFAVEFPKVRRQVEDSANKEGWKKVQCGVSLIREQLEEILNDLDGSTAEH